MTFETFHTWEMPLQGPPPRPQVFVLVVLMTAMLTSTSPAIQVIGGTKIIDIRIPTIIIYLIDNRDAAIVNTTRFPLGWKPKSTYDAPQGDATEDGDDTEVGPLNNADGTYTVHSPYLIR